MRPKKYYEETAAHNHTMRLQASSFLRANPFEGFQVEASASATYANINTNTFTANTMTNGNWTLPEGSKSTARHTTDYRINTLLQLVANYDRTFGKHNVSAMLGASSEVGNIGFGTTQ